MPHPSITRKEGSGDLAYSKLFTRNAIITKSVMDNRKIAWPAISAYAESRMLLSNKLKILNLIGCDKIWLPEQLVVCMVTRPLLPCD